MLIVTSFHSLKGLIVMSHDSLTNPFLRSWKCGMKEHVHVHLTEDKNSKNTTEINIPKSELDAQR
jgi:hypothetical protein